MINRNIGNPAEAGDHQVMRNLLQGQQYKISLGNARMRHVEIVQINNHVPEYEKIEIDNSWTPVFTAYATP